MNPSLTTLMWVVVIILCFRESEATSDDDIARGISGPVPFWAVASPAEGVPTVGIRAAIYSASSVPSQFSVPMLWNFDANATQRMMVQYRVSSSESIPSTSLFNHDGLGECAAELIPVNGSLLPLPSGNLTNENVTTFAGGFLSCDWASYNATPLNAEGQIQHTPFTFYVPSDFDAFASFDVLLWTDNASSFSKYVMPSSNYVLLTKVIDNTTSVYGAIVSNASANFSSSGLSVSSNERKWVFSDSGDAFLTAAVIPFGSDSTIPLNLYANTTLENQHLTRSFCYIPDLTSYVVKYISAGSTVTGALMGIPYPLYPEAVANSYSATQMMQQCDEDQWCIGFTTVMNAYGVEVGEAFFRPRPVDLHGAYDAAVSYGRLAHWRRSTGLMSGSQACTVFVAEDMDLVVRVASANVQAIVMVNGLIEASCVPDPFDCGAMETCATLRVLSGAQVDVVVSSIDTTSPFCPHAALDVLFDAQLFNTSNATVFVNHTLTANRSAEVFTVKAITWEQILQAQLYREMVLRPPSTTFYTYVSQLTYLEAVLQQNAFGYANASSPAITFRPVGYVDGEDVPSAVTCGGSAEFVNNTKGWSDRCDLNLPCPNPIINVTTPMSMGFSGYVEITVNWTIIGGGYSGTWDCTGANAASLEVVLLLTGTPGYATFLYGWPGMSSGTLSVLPMSLVPHDGFPPSGSVPLHQNLSVSTLASTNISMLELFALPETFDAFTGDDLLACVIDSFGTTGASCVFPVPAYSAYLTLTMEDGNIASNAVPYRLVYQDGSVAYSGVCGGGAGFMDGTAIYGSCSVYRTCLVTLTSWIQRNLTNPFGTRLILDVPRSTGDRVPCGPFAFRAIANFSSTLPPFASAACDGFQCKTSGECLTLYQLCDGTTNCADGSDEQSCYNWFDVELNATLSNEVLVDASNPSALPVGFTITSAADCKAVAMRNGSSAFAYSETNNTCLVYNYSVASLNGGVYGFSTSRINTSSFVVYSLLTSPLQYATCTNRLTCSGNGVAGRLSNGACGCMCNDAFTGSICDVREQLAVDFSEIYLLFPAAVNSTAAAALTESHVATALKRWVTGGIFSCNAVLRVDASTLSVLCKDSTGTLSEEIINNATALSTFNAAFTQVGPTGLTASALAPTSIPKFTSSGSSCSMQGDSTFACELLAPVYVSKLAVSSSLKKSTDDGDMYINVTFQSAASRRRLGGARRSISVKCPESSSSKTVGQNSKPKLSCMLDIVSINTDSEPIVSYNIIVLDINGNKVGMSSGGSGAAQASFLRMLLVPGLVTPSNPATIEQDFSIYQWTAIALIGFGLCLMGLVISFCVIYHRHLKRVTNAAIKDGDESPLIKFVSGLFARMTKLDAFDEDEDDEGQEIRDVDDLLVRSATNPDSKEGLTIHNVHRTLCCASMNKRKYAFLCSSFWICAWIVGVFLGLYFITSSAITSDTWVVVERYADSSCQNSTFSPTPQAVFYITDDTATECKKRQVAGNITINFYFSGWCIKNATGDNVIAKYRTGLTLSECKSNDYTEIESNSCIPSATSWGITSGDTTYTRIVCGTTGTTVDRFGYLLALSTETDPTLAATVTTTPSSRIGGAQQGDGSFSVVGTRQSSTFLSSARFPSEFETVASGATPTPLLGKQLLIQHPTELFAVTQSPFYSAETSSLESTYESAVPSMVSGAAVPSALNPFLPPHSSLSLPIGQLYGKFNQTNPLLGSDAGPTATKYYGMYRTRADIGAFIDVDTMKEGQGFTIALMLRATRNTYGFAFAVTDAFEDAAKGKSPILDLMLNIIKRNADGAYWFTEDYHIYNSLLVDGPGMQLQFIYASPSTILGEGTLTAANKTQGKTLSTLTWNIDALGMQRLFNGLWHQIRIVLRMETGTIKVQLIIDGETSRSTFGWNQCLENQLPRIANLPTSAEVNVYNKSQTVGTGAMLWTGYLNGGVSNLRYFPEVEDIFDIWKASSPAIQNYNDINEVAYLWLSLSMFGVSVLACAYLLGTSGIEMYKSVKRSGRTDTQAMFLRYMRLMAAVPPQGGSYYKILKYTSALRWLNVSQSQLGQLLDELQQSTSNVPTELTRLLYLSGDAIRTGQPLNISTLMPTPSQWETLISDDEEKYIADHSWDVLCIQVSGKAEEDPFKAPVERLRDAAAQSQMGVSGSWSALGGEQTPKRSTNRNQNNTRDEEYEHDQGAQAQALQNAGGAAQRGQANLNQAKIGEVNTNNLNIGQGGGGSLSMNSTPVGGNVDIKQLFFPVLTVVQSVYLWISSSNFAGEYITYFGDAFSFISIDFVTTFELPTLVTPLVQLLAGLVAFFFLLYLTAMDEMRFSWYVARYVLKRDNEEHVQTGLDGTITGRSNYCSNVLNIYKNPFGFITPFEKRYEVEVLPVQEAMKVDRFVGISNVDDSDDELAEADTLTVCDAKKRKFQLSRDETTKKLKEHKQVQALRVHTDDKGTIASDSLEVVGVFCREHKGRRLSPQIQTDIWPFMYPPKCCVVINGERCETACGTVYSCQQQIEKEDGSLCTCDYAVCERHYRGGLVDGIKAEVLAVVRLAEQRGSQWVIATAVMLGANAAYMPFVKTAIMILACHPVYQCEFTACHDFTNQKYLIAFYLSLCVVVLFGLGLPLLQVLQLRRRRRLLFHAFFAEDYNGRYEERDSDDHDERAVWESMQRSQLGSTLSFEGSVRVASAVRRLREGSPGSSRRGMRNRGEPRLAEGLDGTTPARGTDDLFNASSSRIARQESSTKISLDEGRQSLEAVTQAVLAEIKSYKQVPPTVHRVIEAVAEVLGESDTSDWSNLSRIVQQDDFMMRLRALSPSTISEERLRKLNAFVADPINTVKSVRRSSHAAGCFITWLRSVVDAANLSREQGSTPHPEEDAPNVAEQEVAPREGPQEQVGDLPQVVGGDDGEAFPINVVEGNIFTNADYPPVVVELQGSPLLADAPREQRDEDRASNASSEDHMEQLDDKVISANSGKVLKTTEWNRFLASDPTVLGTLYKSLRFNWIYLSPILLLWKVVLICPAVFLPFETFEQLVGICATEVGFAIFIFLTAPFTSPIVDVMYRVGSIHQLLFLGFRALDIRARFLGTVGYSFPMVLLTFAYLGFSAFCVFWTVVGPQLRKVWDKKRSTSALESLGYQYTLTTSLYVVPATDAVRFTVQEFATDEELASPVSNPGSM